MNGDVFFRVRFGFLRRTAVHDQAHDFFALDLFAAENLNGVAVALAHFLAVATRHDGRFFADERFGHDEGLAVGLVELDGDVAGDFDVLLLVAADGDEVGIVDENIGGHEDGISEEAVIGGDAVGQFVLVTGATLQQAHGGDGGEQPGQFGDGGDVGLAEEDGLGGVQTAGEEVQDGVEGVLTALGGVKERGHGMVVGDEVEGPAFFLKFHGGLHHPEIIAEMERAGRLNAG